MRLCRYREKGKSDVKIAYYLDDVIVPVEAAAAEFKKRTSQSIDVPTAGELIDLLPPDGSCQAGARQLSDWVGENQEELESSFFNCDDVELRAPFERPNKLLLLAGNYADHIKEGGGVAVEREKTFPYVFMKPASTTINHPGAGIPVPEVSPDHVDWEIELAVVMGKVAKDVSEGEALEHVAGYTVINDISDRVYRPNPLREERPKDVFFDWQHGKWHDGFCPMGPCVVSADDVPNPQQLHMTLTVNGEVRQDCSAGAMVFPVAAVISFISSWVTLEPGDIISTGTPSGIGHPTGTYLTKGDEVECDVSEIGVLKNYMV